MKNNNKFNGAEVVNWGILLIEILDFIFKYFIYYK